MREFDIILHKAIGEVFHVGSIGIRSERPFWLLLNNSNAQAQRLFDQMEVSIGDLRHGQLSYKLYLLECA
ncbi:hypothetical protein SAMN05518849_11244 [Sphingobium sp. AP50]|nr:hypothetical protein SAMN05518849_11244 [Sphingobium sp. AP50]